MEFGLVAISALPSRHSMGSKEAFDYVMKACSVAQESGFEAIGISHKYLSGPAHQFLQPLVMAAHVMARCPGMYVNSNVFLLPYANPVDVAEQIATLDMMAPGKFIFGVGQGYRKDEARAFGVMNNERARRMVESIQAMRLLWQDGPATFRGEFWQFENADIGIKPANGKGPPILMAADVVRSVVAVPERGGDFWIPSPRHSKTFLRSAVPAYREALARTGKPYRGMPLMRDMCVAESKAAAEALVRQSITDYLHLQSGWGQPGERYDVDFEELKVDRLILGTSEEVAEELIALHDEFGVEFVTFRVYTPGMDTERALDAVRKIGDEVLPLVRREVGRASLFGLDQ